MQIVLLRSKTRLDRIRTANAEILNIASSGTVEHSIETVERFNVGYQLHPFITGDLRLCQPFQNAGVQRILGYDVFTPLRGFDVLQFRDRGFLPALSRAADRV